VTLTVLVQEMADCQLFITSADVLQLCSSVLKCSCLLCVRILLLGFVVCSVRAVPTFDCRRGTYSTSHMTTGGK
jgi:hypothetical protein